MKKLWFLCMWLLACAGALYAQEVKQYYNDKTGWSGNVIIRYKYEMEKDDWDEEIRSGAFDKILSYLDGENIVPVTKLSKREKWLMQQALGEYNVADNEVYSIIILDGNIFSSMLLICVRIKDNGRSFDFYARRMVSD